MFCLDRIFFIAIEISLELAWCLKLCRNIKTFVSNDLCCILSIFYRDRTVFCRDRFNMLIVSLYVATKEILLRHSFFAICFDPYDREMDCCDSFLHTFLQ